MQWTARTDRAPRVDVEQWNIPEVSRQVNHHPLTGNLRNDLCVTERELQPPFAVDTKRYRRLTALRTTTARHRARWFATHSSRWSVI